VHCTKQKSGEQVAAGTAVLTLVFLDIPYWYIQLKMEMATPTEGVDFDDHSRAGRRVDRIGTWHSSLGAEQDAALGCEYVSPRESDI
jgi:hypothetical protein